MKSKQNEYYDFNKIKEKQNDLNALKHKFKNDILLKFKYS